MNGILRKVAEARQRQWYEATCGKVLSSDLVVLEENLFRKSLDELKQLDLGMLEQGSNQGWALKAMGAAYELSFNAQRKLIAELIAFEEAHKNFDPQADGKRIYDWIKANGNVFTRAAMHTAFIAAVPPEIIEPPIITQQPAERVFVVEGEPAIFTVVASGTALIYQWYRDDKALLDATKPTYTTYNTDWFFDRAKFHVVIRNSAGAVRSNDAVLRVVKA